MEQRRFQNLTKKLTALECGRLDETALLYPETEQWATIVEALCSRHSSTALHVYSGGNRLFQGSESSIFYSEHILELPVARACTLSPLPRKVDVAGCSRGARLTSWCLWRPPRRACPSQAQTVRCPHASKHCLPDTISIATALPSRQIESRLSGSLRHPFPRQQ